MSFVMMDGKTHQLIDIVENRQLNPLRDYFLRYPRKVREQVRLVVSDFYTPYRTLVKECFPNARIVADRFHISQHIGRAFTNHRIQVMKTFKKGSSVEALKEILETTSKECVGMNGQHRYWRPSFRDHLTEAEIVDRLLYYDDSLKRGYEVYQVFFPLSEDKMFLNSSLPKKTTRSCQSTINQCSRPSRNIEQKSNERCEFPIPTAL